jgi:hypothetical protein
MNSRLALKGNISGVNPSSPDLGTEGNSWLTGECEERGFSEALSQPRNVVVPSTLVVTLQPAENHFLDVQAVKTVYDARVAEALGLRPGLICLMIHSGSRGFGHQICSDHVRTMLSAMDGHGISYGRANRQLLTHAARQAFATAGLGELNLLYDVSSPVGQPAHRRPSRRATVALFGAAAESGEILMRLRNLVVALAVVIAVAYGGPAQAAAVPQADLAAVGLPATVPGVPAVTSITVILHNYGPERVPTGAFVVDYTAPGGAEWRPQDFSGAECTTVVALHRYRCNSYVAYDVDGHSPGGTGNINGYDQLLTVIVKARCTTPGKYTVEYAGDPKPSNNTTSLQVTVDGVSAAECAPKPTAKASAKATPKQNPAISPTAVTSATSPAAVTSATSAEPSSTPSTVATTAVSPMSPNLTALDGSNSAGLPLLISASASALVLVAGFAAVLLNRRRRTTGPATPDTEQT